MKLSPTIKEKQVWCFSFNVDRLKGWRPRLSTVYPKGEHLNPYRDPSRLFTIRGRDWKDVPTEVWDFLSVDKDGYIDEDCENLQTLEALKESDEVVKWGSFHYDGTRITHLCGEAEIDVAVPNPDYVSFADELAKFGLTLDPCEHVCKAYPSGSDPYDKSYRITDPYGHITWLVGNGDDLVCFDYAVICDGKYVCLDSTVNSETGGFIQNFQYEIVEAGEAVRVMEGIADMAFGWCYDNEVRFNRRESEMSVKRLLKEIKREVENESGRKKTARREGR